MKSKQVEKQVRKRYSPGKIMRRLTHTALQALIRKPPTQRVDLIDGAIPGLMLRVGPGGATWSLRIRVVGEGGVTRRGHQKKGNKSRVTLGEYPALSIDGARALASTYVDQSRKGVNPTAALEATATSGGLTVEKLLTSGESSVTTLRHKAMELPSAAQAAEEAA